MKNWMNKKAVLLRGRLRDERRSDYGAGTPES